MSEDFEVLKAKMLERAEQAGVEPTSNLDKIATIRIRFGLDINTCPCAKEDTNRGCISAKCLREIKETGVCHCHCFQRIEDDNSKDL